jgi:HlyD family secretion protein
MRSNETQGDEIKKTLDIESSKKSKKTWIWYVLLLFLLLAGAVYYVMFQKSHEPVKYITDTIKKTDLLISVSATGNIEPTNTVDVGIEVSGTILNVYADFNQHVKKGEVLIRLDTTKLESKVVNARAALLVAKANLSERKVALDDAKNELERGIKMYNSTHKNYPSDKEMDALRNNHAKAIASYKASEAGVTQADAQLKSNEDDLKKALVQSPINGVVLDRKVEAGQSVVAAMTIPVLFTLAEDLTKMKVVLGVDEADIGQVKEGQKVEFLVDAYPEKTFHGVITQVRFNSVILNGVVTYETVVEVNNEELLLRPGMTASAEIITDVIQDTFVVPNAALRFSLENNESVKGDKIWILQNSVPKAVAVKASKTNGIVTSVSAEGLQENMQVIINKETKK